MKNIILDRDGVVNFDSTEYIKSPDEWIPIPGSLEAIATLNRAGYRVFIATNQSGIARGYYDLDILSQIHEKFLDALATVGGCIEEIFYCPHHPEEKCHCRKPNPGMLYALRDKYDLTLADIYFVGDSLSDIELCYKTGCKPILVLTGNGLHTQSRCKNSDSILTFENLAAVAEFLLKDNS